MPPVLLPSAAMGSTAPNPFENPGPGAIRPAPPAAAERLVRDRLAEFQHLASARNSLGGLGSRSSLSLPSTAAPPESAPAGKGGFMREFFDSISHIQATLNKGRDNVKQMGTVLEDALQATTQDRQKEASDRLQYLVMDTNAHVGAAKAALEELKVRSEQEEARKPSTAEGKIRRNMQQAMAKKHQQLLLDFQQAQVSYKQALERRQQQEMEILMPDASEEERTAMIEEGATTALMVTQKMAGAHALLLDEVQRIREKHQDIMRLEASIADLAQMFQEMAVLVEQQGEMLDAIELNVQQAQGYTAKAEKELITTRKAQRQNQRWMCCLSICLLVVVLVVLGPVIISKAG